MEKGEYSFTNEILIMRKYQESQLEEKLESSVR